MGQTNVTQWHGMKQEELKQRADVVPPRPSDYHAADLDATVYATVKFSGNYGANFCGEYQEFTRTQITKDQAHQIAWSTFGLCGHTITYYNDQGNVVGQE
jgi:hypothetical protein